MPMNIAKCHLGSRVFPVENNYYRGYTKTGKEHWRGREVGGEQGRSEEERKGVRKGKEKVLFSFTWYLRAL